MKRLLIAFAVVTAILTGLFASCSSNKGGADMMVDPNVGIYAPATPEGNYEHDAVIENGFVLPEQQNTSTFSLDRNTASYAVMRRQINDGLTINKTSVRIEEYVNYFDYDYPEPEQGEALSLTGTLSDCPWNSESKLLTVGIAAQSVSFEQAKPNNLVFLVDTSGSMYGPQRLGLIQQAFTMLTENLAPEDTVSIVTYASGVRVVAEGLRGTQKVEIANILQDLSAGGSTAGAGGIQLAYEVAQRYFIEDGNNRVLLATDGDFNVGIRNKNELAQFISEKRDTGIWLSVLGVGMYNTSDTTMKTLAENGNGNYGYLDSVEEARKLLVSEMGGTLITVAKDAKINLTFDAQRVEKFRLIGYETKMMSVEDFENEQKDAGEIGSGHTVTAVYEIVLKEGAEGDFVNVEIRYKDPDTSVQKSIIKDLGTQLLEEPVSEDVIFIGCVTEYGLLLRQSQYAGDASFDAVISRLEDLACVTGENKGQFKAEFLQVVKKAKDLYVVNQ